MANKKLERLLDTDELDWDDPRHREIYLREWVNKDGKAFSGEDEEITEALAGDIGCRDPLPICRGT